MKKSNRIIFYFFDQNVLEKISKAKPEYKTFQENFKNAIMSKNGIQALPPFSFLEFIGVQAKDILKISYKGKLLRDYPCRYNELTEITSDIRRQLEEKVTKKFLHKKLLEKKRTVSDDLNETGNKIITAYDNNYLKDNISYQSLLYNLFLDRLSQINTSKFSYEEKTEFKQKHFYPSIMRNICDKTRTGGGFRAIKEMIEGVSQDIDDKETEKKVKKILQKLKLKSHADLADCELIRLACFGYDGHYCCCCTTDSENLIRQRLDFYCETICFIERFFYERLPKTSSYWKNYCEQFIPKQGPDWKCGKVIILDKNTGKKIVKIPVVKIYKNHAIRQKLYWFYLSAQIFLFAKFRRL